MSKKLSKSLAQKMLHRIPFMTLGLSEKKTGKPHVATMLFAIDKDWNISFATHEHSLKFLLLSQNPLVSMCMHEIEKVYFQMSGRATRITDSRRIKKILDEISYKAASVEGFWPPALAISGKDYVFFQVKPDWIRAMDISNLPLRSDTPPYLNIK